MACFQNSLPNLRSCIFSYIFYLRSIIVVGEGNGNPLQYSCLENPMDGGAWWATVYGVVKSQTRLNDLTFFLSIVSFGEGNGNPLQCSCLENPMDGGPGGLQSMGLQRVRHDYATNTRYSHGTLSNSSYEATITLIQKPDKDTIKK